MHGGIAEIRGAVAITPYWPRPVGAIGKPERLGQHVKAFAKKPSEFSCAFEKKAVANGTLCSYDCNPNTMWCSQQRCQNGQFTQFLVCFGSFCSPKCGG